MTRDAPFRSAESAWFWTIRTMHASPIRGAESSDSERQRVQHVIKCLDTLYRHRRIEMVHVRVMRIWGLRGVAPNPSRVRERSDWRIWHEAIERLDATLRAKGIVAGSILQDAAD
jgi:hypothetical protein